MSGINLENVNFENIPGMKEFASLLELNDEEFSQLSPVILKLVEDEFNKPEKRTSLIRESGNLEVVTPEEFKKTLIEECKDELSEIKIDFLVTIYSITYNIILESKKENHISIPIERYNPEAKLPLYANVNDAGMDVYAIEDVTILPSETKLIKTGIKVAIPEGYELQVRPRSGQSLKTKLRIANSPGTIEIA